MNDPTNADPTVLTAERVADMRRSVVSATRPRPRARRYLVPLAAASVLIVGVGVAGSVLDNAGSESSADMITGRAGPEAEPGAGTALDEKDESSDEHSDERQVVTTGHLVVVVPSVDRAVARVEAFVADRGGRIDSRSQYRIDVSRGEDAPASLTVRIPPGEVDALTDALRDLGEIDAVEVTREDVTTQVTDLDARIRSLTVSISRLEAIMAESTSTRDLLEAETQLSQRQGELESLEAQRRQVGGQVDLASISVTLRSEGTGSVDPGGFRGGLLDGWNALVGAVNASLVVLGVLAVWLVPVALVVLVARFAWRRVSRRARVARRD